MTIDEAIKVLQNNLDENPTPYGSAIEDAIQLGIEALKRERLYRENNPELHFRLLPGETKD